MSDGTESDVLLLFPDPPGGGSGAGAGVDNLLLEGGDNLMMEDGSAVFLLE